jgi:CheY-like chemotaxis protein
LCGNESDRERLSLLAGESGHQVHGAGRLAEAVEVLRELRPRLVLIVDSPQQDAEILLRELLRVSPLLPAVVVLKERDATRAVRLMRAGAAEVVAPPWTREALESCLSKASRLPGTVYSVARSPRRPSAPAYFFAVLLFFCAAFGTVAVRRQARLAREAQERKDYWDLPYKHPAGLAFDSGSLWVADWFSQSLYAHDPSSLAVRRVVHFTEEPPVGVAFGEGAVWTAAGSGRIVRRMKDARFSAVQSYPAAAPSTFGMALDGLYLWTCDARKKQISKHLLDADLTVVASYKYPGAAAAALAYDGKTLWSLDAVNRELIRHNLERPDEAVERIALTEYSDGIYRPAGLAWDGERFWSVGQALTRDLRAARLFRHSIGGLK